LRQKKASKIACEVTDAMQAARSNYGTLIKMDNTSDSRWALRLPSDCSIAAIRNVHELVRDAFRREERLEIDCSAVSKADVTSIQLLLSTTKTGQAEGRTVVLISLSQALRNILRRAGFCGEEMIDRHFHQQKKDARWPRF
jgi:ABC-type transporter Mla MlaB component